MTRAADLAVLSPNVAVSGSNMQFDSGFGSVATAYACRAWVNFDGTGTVAIRASGNVSSITEHNPGEYTINMATAMPDVNYAMTGTASQDNTNARSINLGLDSWSAAPTTSTVRINTRNFGTGSNVDCPIVNVSIFR